MTDEPLRIDATNPTARFAVSAFQPGATNYAPAGIRVTYSGNVDELGAALVMECVVEEDAQVGPAWEARFPPGQAPTSNGAPGALTIGTRIRKSAMVDSYTVCAYLWHDPNVVQTNGAPVWSIIRGTGGVNNWANSYTDAYRATAENDDGQARMQSARAGLTVFNSSRWNPFRVGAQIFSALDHGFRVGAEGD